MAAKQDQPGNRFLAPQKKSNHFNRANGSADNAAAAAPASRLRAIQQGDCGRPGWLRVLDHLTGANRESRSGLTLPQQELRQTSSCQNLTAEPGSNLCANRTRYLVQNGDTLESIAASQLGAARLAGLLVTINRGIIDFVAVNGRTVPSIRATQVILLPSASELAIHKKQFFPAHSCAPDTVPWGQAASLTSSDQNHAANDLSFAPSTGNCQPPYTVRGEKVAEAGDRSSPSVPPRKRHYLVLAGDTLQSIAVHDPLMADVNSWILMAKLNGLSTGVDVLGKPVAKLAPGQFLLMPDEDEVAQFKLIKRLMQIAELTGKTDPDLKFSFENKTVAKAKTVIHRLSSICRLQLTDGQASFSLKLEAQGAGDRWTTIAAYEFDDGKIRRHIFRADGSRSSLDIDLPAQISFEMAKQDFNMNWNFYMDCFKRSEDRLFIDAGRKNSFIGQP